jgi:hypothetical protein
MKTQEEIDNMTFSEKIRYGMDLVLPRLIEYKKYKKSVFIVERDGVIMELTPEEVEKEMLEERNKKTT